MSITPSLVPKSCHAFTDDALGTDDAIGLVERLRSEEISPKELSRASIARAKRIDASIQAIDHSNFVMPPSSLKEGLLFSGIPTFLKDNVPAKGLPTQFGTNAMRAKPEHRNGSYVDQYMKLGFHLLGKSSLPEFGLNASTEPVHKAPTRNPWQTDYSAGASSGGAAALVAAGVVPIAHGNDGGGSIRIPAACCGLVGLKPSRGRHRDSKHARQLPINIVSEGVLTRSVRDTAYFHAEMERHYRNKTLPQLGAVAGPGKARLKIALVTDSVLGHETDAATRAAVERTAVLLESMGHHVSPAPFPVPAAFADDFAFYWAMMAFFLKHTGKLALDRSFTPRRLDPFSHGLAAHYRKQLVKTPLKLLRLRQHGETFRQYFNQYDVLLTPTLAHTTPKLSHLSPTVPFQELFDRLTRYVGFTPMANVAGTPAISLPMGFTSEGLPIGVQLGAGFGNEKALLELAYALEEAQPWPQHLDS